MPFVVDLTRRTVEREDRTRERGHFGGSILGLRLLSERTPAGLDAYAPEALVYIAAGMLGGTDAPGLAKAVFLAKSPLTGAAGEAHALGPFAAGMRAAGAKALAIAGRAPALSYVLVEDGQVSVRDAGELRGLGTAATTDALRARHGVHAHVAAIGPAGENLVRYASVVTDYAFPAARYGLGAVLGAKNLKAVVCVPGPGGDGPVPGADPVTLARLAAAYREAIPGNPLASWQHAEPGFAAWVSDGLAPGYGSVRNFSVTGEPGLRLPVAESYAGRALATAGNCPGCPTDCLKVYAPPTTRERRSGGLGQEAFLALGWNLGIDDLDAILDANALANDLGLDQVSLGGTLAFAMECAERGLLPAGAPAFGEPTALPALIHDIAHRSGPYGALLAEGSARAARAIGEEAAPYAMVAKDCELPGFDPRIQPGIGLGYAAAPGGPRYDALEHDLDFDPEEGLPYCLPEAARVGAHPAPVLTLDADRGRRTARLLRLWSALDALNICLFASTPTRPLTIDDILTLVEAASGTPMTLPGLLEAGQTRLDLMHAYALREGVTAESLPSRFHDTPVETGPYQGARLDRKSWSEALTAFKTELGW